MLTSMFPVPDNIIGQISTTSNPIFTDLAPWVLIIGGIFVGLGVVSFLIRSFMSVR